MTTPVLPFDTRRNRYEVTNPVGQTIFTYTFPVDVDTDGNVGIAVYVNNVLLAASDYTVNTTNSTVTLDTAAALAAIVVLQGATVAQREVDYSLRGGLDSNRLNQEAYKFFYLIQELLRDRDRSLILAPSAGSSVSAVIPAPEAGKILASNAAGTGFENKAAADINLVLVSAFVQTLLGVANSTAFLTALGGTTIGRALFIAATADAAQTTLGGTTVGKALLMAASASAAQTTLGISAFVKTILDDADAAAVRATIGAAPTGAYLTGTDPAITLTTTQTITNADAGGVGCFVDYYHNSASPANSDLQGITFSFNSSTGVKRQFGLIRNVIEDVTNTSEDSRFDFQTIIAGTLAQRMKLAQGLVVGTPTGDDKGVGTINASAVYDDNVLLTCYVFDQAVEGEISLDKWDGKVPNKIIYEEKLVEKYNENGEHIHQEVQAKDENGELLFKDVLDETGKVIGEEPILEVLPLFQVVQAQIGEEVRIHEPARKFVSRIGTKYDPLTLDGYAAHWKEKKHLTSLPNEEHFNPEDGMAVGSWMQRLIETVEIQAVLIEQLNQKVKKLEASHV